MTQDFFLADNVLAFDVVRTLLDCLLFFNTWAVEQSGVVIGFGMGFGWVIGNDLSMTARHNLQK